MNANRILQLKSLFSESLDNYSGGFLGLERLDRDLKSVLYSLDEVADPEWVARLRALWLEIEGVYAAYLDEEPYVLTAADDEYILSVISGFREELARGGG